MSEVIELEGQESNLGPLRYECEVTLITASGSVYDGTRTRDHHLEGSALPPLIVHV